MNKDVCGPIASRRYLMKKRDSSSRKKPTPKIIEERDKRSLAQGNMLWLVN